MENFSKKHKFLICPCASVQLFSVDKPFVTEIDGHKCETYIDWFSITFAITMTSCPTLCIPCGFTEKGLPTGIRIVDAPRHEDNLVNSSHKLQTIRSFKPTTHYTKKFLKLYFKYCIIKS